MNTVPIAVLPLENLSGAAAPLRTIREMLIQGLETRGFHVIDENNFEKFMERHRLRYTGGINGITAKAFREETGARAVLITSLELYNDAIPPKISIISRLTSTDEDPVIFWMDGLGVSGDDSPGILDLGLIEDSRVLLGKTMVSLLNSLEGTLSGRLAQDSVGRKRNKYRPRIAYRTPSAFSNALQTVAVLPFVNQSKRKYAGEIMKLHIVKEMARLKNLKVIEPGVVRNELLTYRIVMEDGLSLSQADIVGGGVYADILVTGKVLDYQDYQGAEGDPMVDFSLMLIDRKTREVVWSSKSFNKGTDGVYFFDKGRERTASEMASEMARIVGEMIWK